MNQGKNDTIVLVHDNIVNSIAESPKADTEIEPQVSDEISENNIIQIQEMENIILYLER